MTNPIIPRVGIATDAHQIEAGKDLSLIHI